MNGISFDLLIVLFVGILIVLVVIIVLLTNKKPEVKKTKNVKKRVVNEYVSMPNIIGLSLPSTIENLTKSQLLDIARKVFDTYKVFDYRSMDAFELDKKEWHSWQISLLLMLFKENEEFFIPNKEQIFHQFLLNSNENDIKSFMRGIMKKYENYVNITDKKDTLCKEHIWTNRDISVIFYFLSNFKSYKK
ncbi:MAG: hypothetical protein GY932_15540 [Arcobacter sp.]|nr:hypothetical protein [Arcobacter sp.]